MDTAILSSRRYCAYLRRGLWAGILMWALIHRRGFPVRVTLSACPPCIFLPPSLSTQRDPLPPDEGQAGERESPWWSGEFNIYLFTHTAVLAVPLGCKSTTFAKIFLELR